MANQLKMAKVNAIHTLAQRGWSQRRIAESLGINRRTVARYLSEHGSKCTKALTGYETRSTMMTSNRPLEDWGKLIGDVPSATAILDRFLHHAELITIQGKSYRLIDRAQNSKCTKALTAPKAEKKKAKCTTSKSKAPTKR